MFRLPARSIAQRLAPPAMDAVSFRPWRHGIAMRAENKVQATCARSMSAMVTADGRSVASSTNKSSTHARASRPVALGQAQLRSFSTGTDGDVTTPTLRQSYDNILVDPRKEAGVALITLNRPKALNALNDALFSDLLHATRALNEDESVGCIVLTGSSKAFAAGADVAEMAEQEYEKVASQDMFSQWQSLVPDCSVKKPIIAAVSGYCLGGGCELAMMCDIMVCSESAKFGQPEINLGIIPGAGGTQRLTHAVGKSKAMLWTLAGDFWSADEAYQSGLAAKVFPDEDLVEESIKIASKIASKGRLSVRFCKEAVNASQELSLAEGLRLERRLFHSLFATADRKEGMGAFVEKREPNFNR